MNKSVVIVIPIYKKELTFDEQSSLKQCINILGSHPISFMCPQRLDVSWYIDLIKDSQLNVTFQRFDDKHFKGVNTYSSLLLSEEFYKEYLDYEYMLIYQLDAWVFKDELLYWCNKEYDFIGSPLLKWKSDTDFRDFYCNGGFSLRRIDSMLSIINKKVKLIDILKVYPLSGYFRYLFQFLKVFKPKYSKHNEDFFICEFGKILNPIFKIAPFKDSIRFSFERLPSKLYKLNNNQLPFGCHAYKGYEFNTLWKEFIIN